MTDRIVVVGAGVGGLRAAEALRAAGHAGELVVVGDEPHEPYQRPPLSKAALSGDVDLPGVVLRRRKSVRDVEFRLGAAATGVSLADRTLALADGASLEYRGLVIATGLRARRLDLPGGYPAAHTVRTWDDAAALRAELRPGARLLVIGAGFLGCEIAASAAQLGCQVDVVAPEAEPMHRPLGELVGGALRERHEKAGVRFHLGRLPVSISAAGVAALDDGSELAADVVVEAVGSVPAVEWLRGSGLDLTDGVLTDTWLRAVGEDGVARDDVVAVGDVARFPHPLTDAVPRRVEHYDMPPLTARRAAPALLAGLAGEPLDPEPFAPVPSFWSDQYDWTVQSFGAPELGDDVEIVEGSPDADFLAAYRRGTQLVAAVGVGSMAGLMDLRAALAAGL